MAGYLVRSNGRISGYPIVQRVALQLVERWDRLARYSAVLQSQFISRQKYINGSRPTPEPNTYPFCFKVGIGKDAAVTVDAVPRNRILAGVTHCSANIFQDPCMKMAPDSEAGTAMRLCIQSLALV